MKYWTRIQLALVASILLNVGLVTALPHLVRDNSVLARVNPEPRAVRLNFRDAAPKPEPPQEPVKRLVDSGAEAERPVRDTDLISDKDSQAQDMSDQEGDPNRPAVEQEDDFEELGTPPVAPSQPEPPTPEIVARQPETTREPKETTEPEPEEVADAATPEVKTTAVAEAPDATDDGAAVVQTEDKPDPLEPLAAEPKEAALPPPEPKPERFQVAQAEPAPQVPVQELRSTRGRPDGGATDSGFTSFEANKHALGEYMLGVRNKVEREWRTGLQLRYSGVSRTYAVIECSIRPDGTLEYAKIVEPGSSLTYAVICRQAIEQAAPFGPFPFDVPEIYRTENLQITWKFSYM